MNEGLAKTRSWSTEHSWYKGTARYGQHECHTMLGVVHPATTRHTVAHERGCIVGSRQMKQSACVGGGAGGNAVEGGKCWKGDVHRHMTRAMSMSLAQSMIA